MRPAIRLAALSQIQTIFVFTHDSIGLGEDGPTHQSVEHLAALRAIPNLALIRPCDAHEVREAWRAALLRNDAPTAFALSRQKVALIDRKKFANANGLHKGAYVLAEAESKTGRTVAPKLILIATGSEVGLAMGAREKLNKAGIPTRVVSMPCWEFFDAQPAKYKESVLPSKVRARLAVEAGVSMGWAKYVGDAGDTLSVDRFGASAPAEDVFRDYGFTVENVVKKREEAFVEERCRPCIPCIPCSPWFHLWPTTEQTEYTEYLGRTTGVPFRTPFSDARIKNTIADPRCRPRPT
jgi:transketolase